MLRPLPGAFLNNTRCGMYRRGVILCGFTKQYKVAAPTPFGPEHFISSAHCLLRCTQPRTELHSAVAMVLLDTLNNTHLRVLATTGSHSRQTAVVLVTMPCRQSAQKHALRSPSQPRGEHQACRTHCTRVYHGSVGVGVCCL